jgi:hypothetical protein
VTPARVFEFLLGLILGCFLVPCLGYCVSDSSFFFAFEGGAHTIEKGTRQFGVRHFGSYLTLFLFAILCNKMFLILFVPGIMINPIIQNRIFHFITKISDIS